MNVKNRKELEKAVVELENAHSIIARWVEIIEQMRDEEQEKFDNMSEGLQQSERGSRIEDAAGHLDEAFSAIETTKEQVEYCLEYLQSAIDS